MRTKATTVTSILSVLILSAGMALAGPTAEQKCEAGMNDAAGRYDACAAKAEKGLVSTADMTKYADALVKCEGKLVDRWSKLEADAVAAGTVCPSTGNQVVIQNFVDACVQSIAVAVGGGTLGSDPVTCNADLGTCTGSLGTCSSDLTTCDAALGTCDGDLTTCSGGLGTCTGNLSTCTGDLGTCNGNLGTCNSHLSTTNADLGTCNSGLGTCTGDLGTCNSSLTTCNGNLSSTNADLGTCNAGLTTCSGDLGTCSTSLGTCSGNLVTCSGDLGTCNAGLATCEGDLAAANAGTAAAGDVLTGKTFTSAAGLDETGTMPDNGAVALTPTTADQTIAAGYHNGAGKCAGDSDLSASNILGGVDLFGVIGTLPPARPLKTGQTTSYVAGDDGDLEMGLTTSRTDNGDGTITDNKTGLMWEKQSYDGSIHDWTNRYYWTEAFTVKVAALNAAGGFAGYTDWRVPDIRELQTLIDFGAYAPAVSPQFNTNCSPGCTVLTCSCVTSGVLPPPSPTPPPFWNYWSSTTYKNDPLVAWAMFFGNGDTRGDYKAQQRFSVRGVRGGS